MRRSREIEHVKRKGRRYQTPLFNVVSCPFPEPQPRVSIIVGRRFGTAVVRNRAKRLFRELARHVRQQLVSNRAILVFPRRQALKSTFTHLREVWAAALEHEGLLGSTSGLRCDKPVSG